jgi:hypothetical protein
MKVSWGENTPNAAFTTVWPECSGGKVAWISVMPRLKILLIPLMIAMLTPAIGKAGQGGAPRLPAEPLISVDQVIAMTKAGVPETVILALIDRDRPIFLVDALQAAQLRQKGISERLLYAMIATGYYWPLGYVGYTQPCVTPGATTPSPFIRPGPTSTRGIFFTNPTRGIFFAPPRGASCR